MKRISGILCMFLVATVTFNAGAQLNRNTIKQAQEKAAQKIAEEAARYNNIIDDWDIDYYQSFMRDYPRSKYNTEIKKRIAEIDLWEKARQTNTKAAYENYIKTSQYDHFAVEAQRGIERLMKDEIDAAWRKAVQTNTVASYTTFVETYPNCSYVDNAKERIQNIEAAQAWDAVKNSMDPTALNTYLNKYPSSSEAATVRKRLAAIKGKEYFDRGQLNEAYREFSKLSKSDLPDSSFRSAYDATMEYKAFSNLNSSSSLSSLKSFQSDYPNSKYSTQVNNYIALKLASEFNNYSTDNTYKTALSYATGDTRKRVEGMINVNQNNIKEIKRQEKRQEREENGGTVRMGLEYIDFAWNGRTEEMGALRYNFGLKFQVGNFNDRVQAGVGIKPGFVAYDLSSNETEYAFEMPIEVYAKINLVKTGERNWMFLTGKWKYNAVRDDNIELPMAWGAGLGFSGKHWDFILYYEREIGEYTSDLYSSPQNYFGVSFNYFFKLF